jgi:hypothetical protein
MPVPDVILFHHAQDLTEGVREFTDQLRTAGHQVTVPDLYGGATFDNLDEVGYARQTGFETIIERGQLAAVGLGNKLVYAGFSLGVMPAQMLTRTRPGTKEPCSSTHASRPPNSSHRGRRVSRSRSTAWTATRNSSRRAISMPPELSSHP